MVKGTTYNLRRLTPQRLTHITGTRSEQSEIRRKCRTTEVGLGVCPFLHRTQNIGVSDRMSSVVCTNFLLS